MVRLTNEQIEASIRKAPAIPDPRDERDFPMALVAGADADIPASFSLRDKMTHVKSQGSRGTCTAHASVAIAEFFNAQEFKNPHLNLSEEFLFKKTKEIDVEDYGYDGYGAYLRSSAKAYQKFGACLEDTLPYSGYLGEDHWRDVSISQEMILEGRIYRAKAYARVELNIKAMKEALVKSQAPLLVGFMLYENYHKARDNGGFFPVPKAGEGKIGGHAMAVVGYTDTHFECKNSWGNGWGDEGYCWFPFEAFQHVFSPWSFLDLIDKKNLEQFMIEQNFSQVSDWAKGSWQKAMKKEGLVNANTKALEGMNTQRFFEFLDRLGLLD